MKFYFYLIINFPLVILINKHILYLLNLNVIIYPLGVYFNKLNITKDMINNENLYAAPLEDKYTLTNKYKNIKSKEKKDE